EQHIAKAASLGMDTVGFLMMSHRTSPENLLEEAKKMESYGAQTVYAVDSAGALTMDGVKERISLLRNNLSSGTEVGFHGHNNLSLAVANSVVAIEEGAGRIDSSLAGMGAGAGNTATEQLVAVLDRIGVEHNLDLYNTMDAAENLMQPM